MLSLKILWFHLKSNGKSYNHFFFFILLLSFSFSSGCDPVKLDEEKIGKSFTTSTILRKKHRYLLNTLLLLWAIVKASYFFLLILNWFCRKIKSRKEAGFGGDSSYFGEALPLKDAFHLRFCDLASKVTENYVLISFIFFFFFVSNGRDPVMLDEEKIGKSFWAFFNTRTYYNKLFPNCLPIFISQCHTGRLHEDWWPKEIKYMVYTCWNFSFVYGGLIQDWVNELDNVILAEKLTWCYWF